MNFGSMRKYDPFVELSSLAVNLQSPITELMPEANYFQWLYSFLGYVLVNLYFEQGSLFVLKSIVD